MNGKELKVAEIELKFGAQARMVNVFGLFRYKPNNGLYVIYSDVGNTYNYVCYGLSHIKNNSILCMNSNKPEDIEAIKEYIYKVTNGEKLDDYEIISLDDVDEIEIISSKNFELKKEVLDILIDKTIPKKQEEVKDNNKSSKKKSPLSTFLLILFLLIIAGGGYLYFMSSNNSSDNGSKIIVCAKQYDSPDLEEVIVEEEKKFIFNNYDKLDKVKVTTRYIFDNEAVYLDFINKSLFYKYMPENNDDTTGSHTIDDANNRFVTYATTVVDESYGDPVEYEEVLSSNTNNNYTCDEKIEK